MNATSAFQQIIDHATANQTGGKAQFVTPTIGQYVAQGDVNFLLLAEIPKDAVPCEPVIQLATGTTRGSRHCIAVADVHKVDYFAYPNPNPLEGPTLRFREDTRIEHPEHGDYIFPAGTIVAVGYQRQYAEEIRRIED